jgi:hypothetical protein
LVAGRYRAVVEKWIARDAVPRPSLSVAGLALWHAERQRCWAVQRELEGYLNSGLEICSGPGSAHNLLLMAAGKRPYTDKPQNESQFPAGEIVRIPRRYLDALESDGHLGRDPGASAGHNENYCFLIPAQGRTGWMDPYLACLVHGVRPGSDGPFYDLSPRSQLERVGVTDPEILSQAWDVTPMAGARAARLQQLSQVASLMIICSFLLRLHLHRRRRIPRRLPGIPAAGSCPACASRKGPALWVSCPTCETAQHQQCWDYMQGCSIFGCRAARPQKTPLKKKHAAVS